MTTPESLSLLLTYAEHPKLFRCLQAVVVDEWHELLGSKRGVQLELALARLWALVPGLRIWGLSATIANLDQAMDTLLGGAPDRLIRGMLPAAPTIHGLTPETIERFPWAGHLGTQMLAPVLDAIAAAGTTPALRGWCSPVIRGAARARARYRLRAA